MAKVSMEDIAKKLGISKNTVSLSFRNFPGISEQTRSKIIETANSLGYIYKKESSISGENKSINNICLIIPSSAKESPLFFSHVQFGIEDAAKANGLSTIISYYNSEVGLSELPLCIQNNNVSGIITLGRIDKSVYTTLKQSGLPIVMTDHYFEDELTNCVLSDNFCGGYIAAKHLISKGHKDIGFIGGTSLSVSFYDRYLGYKKAMDDSKYKMREETIINISLENLANSNFKELSENILAIKKLPTTFFCCNDAEAITLINVFHSLEIKVPEDISIIGFDNIDASKSCQPNLTTIDIDKERMGSQSVKMLLEIIEQNASKTLKLVVGVNLVERNSVNNIVSTSA